MEDKTDEMLMQKVKQGSKRAVSILFERYRDSIYSFFMRMTHDAEASKDLTQTTFLRVLRYHNSYDPNYTFRSWLYRLARNQFHDNYRKDRRRQTFIVEAEDHGIDLNIFGDKKSNQFQIKLELEDALSKLKSDDRELIIMSKFQGLKYDEMSEVIGISTGAIKTKMHRAMLKLKSIFYEERAIS